MKKLFVSVVALGLLAASSGAALAAPSDLNQEVVGPEGYEYVYISSWYGSNKATYGINYSGSWTYGNGFYVHTVSYMDGTYGNHSGSEKSYSWYHQYSTEGTYYGYIRTESNGHYDTASTSSYVFSW